MDTQQDWSIFNRRININKPVSELYKAWTTPAMIREWFLEKADFETASGEMRDSDDQVQVGDTYFWKWHGWGFTTEGTILETNGKDHLKFTFGEAGDVEVKLEEDENGTHVILSQKNIPTDEQSIKKYFYGCSLGWSFWLVNLKAWLEHGIKLNETGVSFDELSIFEYVNA